MPTPTRPLLRNTPIFFRKEAVTDKTSPNANFLRYMDVVLCGDEVVEIEYQDERWTCKESEALTQPQAMIKLAKKIHADVEAAKVAITKDEPEAKITQLRLADRLSICVSTLADRLSIVKNFLPKP